MFAIRTMLTADHYLPATHLTKKEVSQQKVRIDFILYTCVPLIKDAGKTVTFKLWVMLLDCYLVSFIL